MHNIYIYIYFCTHQYLWWTTARQAIYTYISTRVTLSAPKAVTARTLPAAKSHRPLWVDLNGSKPAIVIIVIIIITTMISIIISSSSSIVSTCYS